MIKGLQIECFASCTVCQRGVPQRLSLEDLISIVKGELVSFPLPHGLLLTKQLEIMCWDCAKPEGRGGNESMASFK